MAEPLLCFVCKNIMAMYDDFISCYHMGTKFKDKAKPVIIHRMWIVAKWEIERDLREARKFKYGHIMTG